MGENLFISVTENGAVYNRTNAKNKRLYLGESYKLNDGDVVFIREDDKIFVRRSTEKGQEVYTKEITEPGMYLVSSIFVQPMPKTPKEVRKLYNRLKETIGKPHFKIDVNEKARAPFKIRLHTWLDKGFNYRFIITVKESVVSPKMAEQIYNLINRTSELDLRSLIQYYNAFDKNGLVVTVNEEFLDTAKTIISARQEVASGK
jgi:molybdopterin converting factor small subunit